MWALSFVRYGVGGPMMRDSHVLRELSMRIVFQAFQDGIKVSQQRKCVVCNSGIGQRTSNWPGWLPEWWRPAKDSHHEGFPMSA